MIRSNCCLTTLETRDTVGHCTQLRKSWNKTGVYCALAQRGETRSFGRTTPINTRVFVLVSRHLTIEPGKSNTFLNVCHSRSLSNLRMQRQCCLRSTGVGAMSVRFEFGQSQMTWKMACTMRSLAIH